MMPDLAETARHEAGHAFVTSLLGIDSYTARVNEHPDADGVLGQVRYPERPRIPESEVVDHFPAEYARGVALHCARDALVCFAGVAAQFHRTDFWSDAHTQASADDRESLYTSLHFFGFEPRRGEWPAAFMAACSLIDQHWGAVATLASVLLARRQLDSAEAERIIAGAPKRRNPFRAVAPWPPPGEAIDQALATVLESRRCRPADAPFELPRSWARREASCAARGCEGRGGWLRSAGRSPRPCRPGSGERDTQRSRTRSCFVAVFLRPSCSRVLLPPPAHGDALRMPHSHRQGRLASHTRGSG